jgi:acetyl esterase/lipase
MRTIGRSIFRLLVLAGLFFSSWIVLPAPIYALLPLSVGMPEISPGLVCLNAAILILGGIRFWLRYPKKRRRAILNLCCIVLALSLSASPLMQFTAAQTQAERSIEASLGRDYLQNIPPLLRATMRSQPLIMGDLWRGIPRSEVRIDRNIPFAHPDGKALCLDIYRPARVGKYPGIVSIYGGAWQRGSPASDDNFNRYIAAQGYVVWAISYRHAPAYHFPAQLDDVRSALSYIKNRAASHETDLDRMGIIGRSAGAQLAMLVAYAPTPFPLRAVVDYYGPVDLTAGYDRPPVPDPIESRATLLKFLGGTPQQFAELYRQASPINAVRFLLPKVPPKGLPASLLIYGGKDHIVEAKYGKHLAQLLRSQGNRAAFVEIPWADHAFDAVFNGLSNQLALYHTERFLAGELQTQSRQSFAFDRTFKLSKLRTARSNIQFP